MIDWKSLNIWARAEYIAASDTPEVARERIDACAATNVSEWTPEEKYGVTSAGSREPRFTIQLGEKRFVFHPAMNGGRYQWNDLGAAS